MIVVFVFAMIAGVALGVRVMVSGVLRAKPAATGRPVLAADRVALGPPLLAVAATVFGVVGVGSTRILAADAGTRVAVSGAVAALTVMLAVVVIRRWARASDEAPLSTGDDPRFALQGLPARVTHTLGGTALGEIAYEVDGVRQITPAYSVDATPIAVGVEVVIERIDRGVAWVEPWAEVEQRL